MIQSVKGNLQNPAFSVPRRGVNEKKVVGKKKIYYSITDRGKKVLKRFREIKTALPIDGEPSPGPIMLS
jgi:DNA-binding PadR family transcriptional regulator